MSMNAKYEYYLNSYLENRHEEIPKDKLSDLERKAFTYFTKECTESELRSIVKDLRDESDIPSYGLLLLDYEDKIDKSRFLDLPYKNPYKPHIDDIVFTCDAFKKKFDTLQSSNYDEKLKKKYEKIAFAIMVLEDSVDDIFLTKHTDTIIHTYVLDNEEIFQQAESLCNHYFRQSIGYEVKRIISKIETNMMAGGWNLDNSNPSKPQFTKNGRTFLHPCINFMNIDYADIYGSDYVSNSKPVKRALNAVAHDTFKALLRLEKDVYYTYYRNFFKRTTYDASGNTKTTYILTESSTVARSLLSRMPESINSFEDIKYLIVRTYNKLKNATYSYAEVREDLKSYEERSHVKLNLLEELQKLLFMSKDELEILSHFLTFFNETHSFSYYPKTKTRTKNNLVSMNMTYSDFAKHCSDNSLTSADLKLVAFYTAKNESYLRKQLNKGDINFDTLRRSVKRIFSKDLFENPDEFILERVQKILNNSSTLDISKMMSNISIYL